MGDKKRFTVFADWIAETFPTGRVLDVAGGGGYLSLELVDRGFEPVIVDPRVRKHNRLAVSRLERSRRLEKFNADMARGFDLVVGLHPDGATQEIVRAVKHCPVVVVPCCNYWPGHDGDVVHACRAEWIDMGACLSETELDMSGKNLVLRASR